MIEHAGNTVTVIAPTAEEAMAIVGDAGPGFRTTSIGKVRRGGLAGFFATEMVRVVAESSTDLPVATRSAAPSRPVAPVGAASPLQLATADDLIASLCGSDGPFAGRLAAGLQRSLEQSPPVDANTGADDFWRSEPAPAALNDTSPERQRPAPAPVAEPVESATVPNIGADDLWRSEPAPAGLTDRSPGRRRHETVGTWSAAALEAAGLPASLVGRVAGVRPHDEVTWNAALMLALRDWCGADVPAAAVMSGPTCARLAAALHVPIVDAADVAERDGRVAVPSATAADLAGAGGRPLHLVVGGSWRHLATVRPALVSAAADDDLVDAVRVAVAWDAPLGWLDRRDGPVRIDPFLLAAHVRALLAVDAPRTRTRNATTARRAPAAGAGRASVAGGAAGRVRAETQEAGR